MVLRLQILVILYFIQVIYLGNWHFVFLDSCLSAANTNFSNAFHIYSGSTNKAFLGWYNTVNSLPAYYWTLYFKNYIGTDSIKQLAIDAANSVTGNGTTPIRFYGDPYWYGWAWNT